MKRWLTGLGILAVCLLIHRKQADGTTQISGRAMGCDWKFLTDEKVSAEELRAGIARELEHWEQVLSTWRPDSDLSRHNRGEAASADLRRVIEMAERFHADTGGAFDHRMLDRLTAAGFGPGGTGIDLSSIGKGFAVDRVAERLHDLGIRRYVFALAGEVRAGEGEWPVGIEDPHPAKESPPDAIRLSGRSLATSGNYRQGVQQPDGRIASHILEPATGKPVLRFPCSVTVIGPDAASASAWATALFVKGPEASAPPGMQVIWRGKP